jgi:hypothetical protein
MDDWDAWRVAIVVTVWQAVAGVEPHRAISRQTTFASATVIGHGLMVAVTALLAVVLVIIA